MISAATFKKQISKPLASQMRTLGFKGSGFNYKLESEEYLFVIGIQASQYGGQCCAELGVQPKALTGIDGEVLEHNKLKYYECEFRTRLMKNEDDQWWQYSENEKENISIAQEIFEVVVKQAMPVISLFKNDPNILHKIEVADLNNIYNDVARKLAGMTLMTTEVRLAWALTKVFEVGNLEKSKEFARFGLSKLDDSSTFLGRKDFEKVLHRNNGA